MSASRASSLFCLLMAAVSVARVAMAADPEPTMGLDKWLETTRYRVEGDCKRFRAQEGRAEGMAKTTAEMGIDVNCRCMPQQLDKLQAAGIDKRPIDSDQAKSVLMPLINACGAISMRKHIATACESSDKFPPGVKDHKAFCGCLSDGLGQITDDQLVADSLAAYRNFEEKVQARKDGRPDPPRHQGVTAGLEQRCTLQATAAP